MFLANDKTFPILEPKACPRCEHKPCHAFARKFARHAMLVHPQEVPHTCPLRVPPFSDISRYRIDLMDVTKEEVIRVGMRGGTGISKHAYDGNTPAFKLIEVLYRTKNIEILIAPYGSDAFKKITGWRGNKISSARKREEEKQVAEKKEIEKEKPKPGFVEASWVWLEDPKRPGCDERELSTGVMKEALWCKVDTEGLMPGDRVTFSVYLKSRDGKEDIKITTEEGSVGKGRKDDAAVAKWLIPEQIRGYNFQPKIDQVYFIAKCLAHQLEMRTSQNKFLTLTPKPSLIFRNPKWEIEKVGFEEETDISVELELSPEHAGNTKVTFELFAKTPKGPELVHQGEGHVDGGKATCRIPVYIPKYKDTDGNSLQKVGYYFTAKHSESEPLDSSTTPKIINEMAERLIESHILPDLNFTFDQSFLHPKHAAELKDMCVKIKAWREKNPEGKLAVFGHADAVGKEEYNKALSERRAKSVFAFLIKDAEAWSELDKEEKWGLACIQDLLKHLGHDPGSSDGQDGPKTQAAVKEFQTKKSLPVDGQAGAGTRKALYQAFIEDSNSLSLKAKDFDVIDGKSHTGCSEFNLVEKTEGACEANRRVAVLLLKSNKNFPINYPCKQGDIGPCKIQKAKKGERRTPGFCCFFYDDLVEEKPAPPPSKHETDLKGRLFWNRTWDYMDETIPISPIKEFLPGAKVELEIKKAGETEFKVFGSAVHLTDGIDKALVFPHVGAGVFNFKAVPKCEAAQIKISLEYEGGKIVCVKGKTFRTKTKFKDEPDFKIITDQTVSFSLPVKLDAVDWTNPECDLGELEINKTLFVDICDAYKSVWTGYKRIKEMTNHEMELCRINFPEDPKITVSNAGEQMQLCELDLKDRAVILHEYGHFIGTKILGGLDNPGYGYNDDITQSHGGTTLEHYESAWNEGHATFLSCALTDNPHYHDGYDTKLDFFLDSDGTKLGPHCEGSIQEALWQIYKVAKTDFKDGFWKAFTDRSLRTCRTIFDFFDNWRDLKLPKLNVVVETFKDFGMEFGYLYPSGPERFQNVSPPNSFSEAKKEFENIPELHTHKGSLGSGTLIMYNEEFYNRNKHLNPGNLATGSTIASPKVKPGKHYIAPIRIQVKP